MSIDILRAEERIDRSCGRNSDDYSEVETTRENEANFLGVPFETMFPGECQRYRWSKFKNLGSADEMYEVVSNGVFPFIKNLHQDEKSAYARYMGIVERFHHLEGEADRARTEQSFLVPLEEIAENDYDLSVNKYKEIVYEKVEYEPTDVILGKIEQLETQIQAEMTELKKLLEAE